MLKLIFATKNNGKVVEVSSLLKDSGIQIVSLLGLGNGLNIVESGLTFEENAKIKAEAVYGAFRVPVIADDSGLSVDQLDGKPGVYSARYAGDYATDQDNNRKLLFELSGMPEPHKARFICSAVYYDGKNFIGTRGEVNGRIIKHARGSNGFGYDPLFMPDGYDVTSAELSMEEKNKISHRAIAFRQLGNLIIKSSEKI